jgi:hypothetical protein
MTRKPEPTKPTTWTFYKIAAKQLRLGTADAPDETAAFEKASKVAIANWRGRLSAPVPHEGVHLCKLWRFLCIAST